MSSSEGINPRCLACINSCKQSSFVRIVICPLFERKPSPEAMEGIAEEIEEVERKVEELHERVTEIIKSAGNQTSF